MKRILAAILCIGLLGAYNVSAAGFDEPALINPKDRYDMYVEETDGSELLVFNMLDILNDEAQIVAENGSMTTYMTTVDAKGEPVETQICTIQMCDYGKMQILSMDEQLKSGALYLIDSHVYMAMQDELVEKYDGENAEVADENWESYRFPFQTPLTMMHGMREDASGNAYFLVRSGDSMALEYATGGNMKIGEIRLYALNDREELALVVVVTYSEGAENPFRNR